MPENWDKLVKAYRVRHGLSQTQLAKLIDVSQRTISRWERGEDSPGIAFKKRLRELTREPPDMVLRSLQAAVRHCPAPRALTRARDLQLLAVSKPALEKRPSIANWMGKSLLPIARGILQEMLDDRDLQKAIANRDVAGVVTTARSVLETEESAANGTYCTTISYFSHEGTLYSDAISAPVADDQPCGYIPFTSDD